MGSLVLVDLPGLGTRGALLPREACIETRGEGFTRGRGEAVGGTSASWTAFIDCLPDRR